ncbi:MAG: DUF2793 domain-containing protein [Parvibaculum sp.]|nr:DUF2793 domain-containing protein [Parvibaculum sp.]
MSFETTHFLGLPQIMPSQAQKHVTHNEALRILDALVHLAVKARDLAAPPPAPAPGERHIVAAGALDAWSGRDGEIAAWLDGAWAFFAPQPGWRAWIEDEEKLVVFSDGGWTDLTAAAEQAETFGINTEADTTNRLAVKSDAALFSHDDQTPGSGDMRVVLNKAAEENTASILFQNDAEGRAEFGLTGNDDFSIKMSADGETWKEVVVADRATGTVRLPGGLIDAQTLTPLSGLMFAPLIGTGQNSIYRIDAAHAQNPRSATVSAVSGNTITLTAHVSNLFFVNAQMSGTVFARIWNTSKAPAQSAWVEYSPASNQLNVHDAADIATWSNGDTVQIGDPHSTEVERAMALDISPFLENQYGGAFHQAGIVLIGSMITAATTGDALRCSPNKAAGSYTTIAHAYVGGVSAIGQITMPCNIPSPISDSNLIFLQETIASTVAISLANIIGVFR